MAKKSDPKGTTFDDLNFDDELDIGGFEQFNPPKTGGRAVIEEAKNSFLGSVKSTATNRGFIRRLIGLTMPKGYSQLFNAYDSTREGIGKIYADNEAELRPHMAKASRMLNQRKSRFRFLLPKAIRDAMDMAEDREKSAATGSEQSSELASQLNAVNDLFKLEVNSKVEQRIDDGRKELKEDAKYKLNMGLQTDISSGVSQLVSYQNTFTINFQRRSLEIGYRQFDVQHRLLLLSDAFFRDNIIRLDAIAKNTAMPDYVKLKTTEAIKDRLRQRLADAAVSGLSGFRSNYFKNIIGNISGMVGGALSLGGMAGGMGDGLSRAQMLGMGLGTAAGEWASPKIQWAGEQLAEAGAPYMAKIPGVKDTGDRLRIFLADPVGYLNRIRHSDTTDTGMMGWIQEALKSVLPAYTPADKIEGLGVASLGDDAKMDNLLYTSITQVMPAYLESIDKHIRMLVSGKEEEGQAWSHYTGGMVSRSTLDNQHLRVGVFRGQGQNTRREIARLIKEMGGEVLSPAAQGALAKKLFIELQKGQGFNLSNYTKPDSWHDVDETIADELIDFFAEQFDLDFDGKFVGNDRGFLADVTEAFKDASERLPKSLERAQILSERVMGRDVLRRLGLSKYDGFEGDQINLDAWADRLLGGDDIDVSNLPDTPKEETKSSKGLFESLKNIPTDAIKRQQEALEAQRIEKERAAAEGKFDVIDTVQNLSATPKGRVRQRHSDAPEIVNKKVSTTTPLKRSTESEFKQAILSHVSDSGTHEKLDRVIALLTDTPKSPNPSQDTPKTDYLQAGKALLSGGLAKGKQVIGDLRAKAEQWYNDSPKIQQVVTQIESTYGKITDPELRTKIIHSIYEHTGTPDEIVASLTEQFEKMRKVLGQGYVEGKGIADEKMALLKAWSKEMYGKRHEFKDQVVNKAGEAKTFVKDKFKEGQTFAKDLYENREKHYQTASDKVKDIGSQVKDAFVGVKDTLAEWLEKRTLMGDVGTHDRLDVIIDLLSGMEGVGGSAERGDVKPGLIKRGLHGLAEGGKWAARKAGSFGLAAMAAPFRATWWGVRKAYNTAKYGIGEVFNNPAYGARDVLVEGDPTVRLKANGIRNGQYLDKNSGKVIHKLKDITGAVIDQHSGNEVLSQEEFDNGKLVDGKGDSLAMYLTRTAANVAGIAARLTTAYVGSTYGLLWKGTSYLAKKGLEVARDQFTQFDAYFPGDDRPRIRSRLMKEGYYRDKEGTPIMSLKDIKGPVYDIDGNEVISQEDIEKYKSLYTRNGSLLFTFGRGVISLAKFATQAGTAAAKAMMAPGLFLIKKGFSLGQSVVTGGVNRLMNLFNGKRKERSADGVGGYGDSLAEDILIEQLRIQHEILTTLKSRKRGERGVEHDSDGDGVRDNSWADIFAKRSARRARGPNADVVDAINNLGDSLDKNFDELKDTVEDSGEKGSGGIIDTLKKWGASIAGGLGLGSLAGGAAAGAGAAGKKGLLRTVVGGLGRAALWTTKKTLGAAWGITKFAAKRLVVPLAIGAVKVAGAVVAAVGWPVVLAGIAIGAIGYMGYQHYKGYKFDQKPLYHLRMTQYGIDYGNAEDVDRVLQLETLLSNAIVKIDTNHPDFNPSLVDMRRIYQIFGLLPLPNEENPESGAEDDIDKDRQERLIRWLAYRFKPVYLKHCSALYNLKKSYDLNKVDESVVSKEHTTTFLDNVQLHDAKAMYNDVKNTTPFSKPLAKDNDDVVNAFKRVRKLALKRPVLVDKAPKDDVGSKVDASDAPKLKAPQVPSMRDLEVSDPNVPDGVTSPRATLPTPTDPRVDVSQEMSVKPLSPTPAANEVLRKVEDGVPPTETPITHSRNRYADIQTSTVEREALGMASDAEIMREINRQTEAIAIRQIDASTKQSGNYLQQTVVKLGSIDKTLLRIEQHMTKNQASATTPTYVAEAQRQAEVERLARQNTNGRSNLPVQYDASERSTVSVRREGAMH